MHRSPGSRFAPILYAGVWRAAYERGMTGACFLGKEIHCSPRYLTQHNDTLRRVTDPPIGKNGALPPHFGVAKLLIGNQKSQQNLSVFSYKSCFLPAGANLTNKIQIISLEYCKIHGHFVLPCPPGHGTILKVNHTIYINKIYK